jgi:hypothetical protein
MGVIRRMQTRVAALAGNEHGMAVPIVLTVMIIGLGFSAAAITVSISAQSGTNRDQDSKDALAIADAGVHRALLNKNKIEATNDEPCVVKDTNGDYTTAPLPSPPSEWCAPVGGPTDQNATVGNGYFRYWVKPCLFGPQLPEGTGCNPGPAPGNYFSGLRLIKIVAEGYQDGGTGLVTRRVAMTAYGWAGSTTNSYTAGAIGRDSITTDGNSKINTNVGTNGDVVMDASSELCGDIQVGKGHQVVNPEHQCPGYTITEGHVTLPPVKISDSVCAPPTMLPWPECDNGRITTGLDPATGNISWNPGARTLSMQGNSTLTLGGGDYSFCSLDTQGNSKLIMAAGAHVRIFFDSPEACGLSTPVTQIDVTGDFASTAWDPGTGNFDLIQMYMIGSTASPPGTTLATFWGSSDNQFQLYAPGTDVSLGGNASYWGGVAAKTLALHGSAELNYDPKIPPPGLGDPDFVRYEINNYVECGPPGASPGASPDANC